MGLMDVLYSPLKNKTVYASKVARGLRVYKPVNGRYLQSSCLPLKRSQHGQGSDRECSDAVMACDKR